MKVKVSISNPWAGIPDDVEIIEIDEGYDVDEVATEVASEMVWERVGVSYEILD